MQAHSHRTDDDGQSSDSFPSVAASSCAAPAAWQGPGSPRSPQPAAAASLIDVPAEAARPEGPLLVFDGGCPFCRHFAELSELRSGIPDLRLCDGRADHALRRSLASRGFHLHNGAMVLEGSRVLHGAEAIAWLCRRMQPSAALLRLLAPLLAEETRARRIYPGLLLGRRLALAWRGLPLDPDRPAGLRQAGPPSP